MNNDENPIVLAVENLLKNAGFRKKGRSWYRTNPEVLEVVNLQRSQFGPQYYINYALWLNALGTPNFPKEYQCHIRMRETTFGKDETMIRTLLDLSREIDSDDRQKRLVDFLLNSFLPLTNECRSLDQLRMLYHKGQFSNVMMLKEADSLLNAQP